MRQRQKVQSLLRAQSLTGARPATFFWSEAAERKARRRHFGYIPVRALDCGVLHFVRLRDVTAATLTSKHQITIPPPVRRVLGLHRGDRILFTPDSNGGFILRRAADSGSDGFARKYLQTAKAGTAMGKAQASRLAAAAAYRRRNG